MFNSVSFSCLTCVGLQIHTVVPSLDGRSPATRGNHTRSSDPRGMLPIEAYSRWTLIVLKWWWFWWHAWNTLGYSQIKIDVWRYLFQNTSPFLHCFSIVTLCLTIGDEDNIEWDSGLGVFAVDVGIVKKLENIANARCTATENEMIT